MKKTKYILGLALLSLGMILYSCQEDDQEFGEVAAPTNLTLDATVLNTSDEFPNGDGSGLVSFEANAEGAITYEYFYGDNTSEVVPSGDVEYGFKNTGTHEYVVTVVARGTGGASTSTSTTVTVFSAFEDPETQNYLTGGASKTWYVAAALPAHLGVGPSTTATPDYYAAAPFEKESVGCFYDDAITFSENGGSISFVHDNMGATFFNVDLRNILTNDSWWINNNFEFAYEEPDGTEISLSIGELHGELASINSVVLGFIDGGEFSGDIEGEDFEVGS
jgi:hypothetical protein